MELELFLNDITECIRERISQDVDIYINSIQKNNGVTLSGLCIRKKGENVTPTIYMEHYFEQYRNGADIYDIADEIVRVYCQSSLRSDFDAEFYKNYENVRKNLYCKVINYDMNTQLLKDVPYGKCWDLAIVPYYELEDEQIGTASILVRNSHLEMWNITENELLQEAIANTSNTMEFEVMPMLEMLRGHAVDVREFESANADDNIMMVATNKRRHFGAVFIIFKDKLKEMSDTFGCDYYIIPSSVHELILMPVTQDNNMEYLDEMITYINEAEVSREEVLANHAYMYVRQEEVLKF